jgi:NADH-quinone oxidoreductase subunit C
VTLTQSSIRYLDGVPEGVPAAAREALAPFEPRWSEHRGDVAVLVPRESWFPAFEALKQAGYDYLVDHTAVDYPDRQPRFTVVGLIQSMATQHRLIVKTRVADGQPVASLVPLWSSANWAERETYDMFGIPFEGHPDLTRIYMPEDYEGWPQRRDFPLQGHLRFRD